MITVQLLDVNGLHAAMLRVPPNLIADAGCVQFNGRYYTYSGMEGRFFGTVKFNEIRQPVFLSPDLKIG